MSKVVEKVGGFVDKLLGSPIKKSEKRAERAAEAAQAQAKQAEAEEAGVRASRVLAVDAQQRKKRAGASTGSASAILTGQSGPALPR